MSPQETGCGGVLGWGCLGVCALAVIIGVPFIGIAVVVAIPVVFLLAYLFGGD